MLTDRLLPIREALLDALALVLPIDCVGCGAPDRALCVQCRAELRAELGRASILRDLPDGTPVTAATSYDGVARAALLAFKDAERTELIGSLAPLLGASVGAALNRLDGLFAGPSGVPSGVLLCPVPSTRAARRQRGYDPLRMLLNRAGCRAPRLLVARRHTAQKSLAALERAGNLMGTMSARRELIGQRVLLVDDIITTGSTLLEAARAVRDAGGQVVGAAVLASTPRRFEPLRRKNEAPPVFPSMRSDLSANAG